MTSQRHDSLESQLSGLTEWPAPPPAPELWTRALASAARKEHKAAALMHRVLTWPIPKALAASIVVVLAGATLTALLLPSIGKARDQVSVTRSAAIMKQLGTAGAAYSADWAGREITYVDDNFAKYGISPGSATGSGDRVTVSGGGRGLGGGDGGGGGSGGQGSGLRMRNPQLSSETTAHLYSAMVTGTTFFQPGEQSTPSAERAVIRKATLELTTADVRAAFLKAMHVVSEAGSEYVQDSNLTGTGKDAQAYLTLRVAVDHLAAVLNELRELGTVQSERIGGEDVTAQVVDLDARLRNEQRVEKELLELMEKRQDSPLKEILELRDNIGQVRQQIEQITAQRERLGRLVSLATVLVIIRTDAAVPVAEEVKKQSIGEYFGASVSASWLIGLQFLADSLSAILRVVVGGSVWWIAAIAALLALRQRWQRKAMMG